MRSKLLSSMLVLLLSISLLSSCSQTKEDNIDKVGVILPSNTELKWTSAEKTFAEYLNAKNIECEVLYSQNSLSAETTSVEALIERGADVLIFAACDPDSDEARKCVQRAKKKGLSVICYEELVTKTDNIDYFASFSAYDIGKMQGEYLANAYKEKENIPLYLYAGELNDENIKQFAGAWSVLSDAVKSGEFKVENSNLATEQAGKTLDPKDDAKALKRIMKNISANGSLDTAKILAKANLDSHAKDDKGDVAVLSLSDEMTQALIEPFSADTDVKKIVITGSGAEIYSLKLINSGKQSMTMRLDIKALAKATAEAAEKILNEEDVATSATENNGEIDVPTLQAKAVIIDKETLDKLVSDGVYSKEDVTPEKKEKKE